MRKQSSSKKFLKKSNKKSKSERNSTSASKSRKNSKRDSAYMELIIGPMFAGKTSHLMNMVDIFTNHNEKIKVLIVNHTNDVRIKGGFIATHDKKKMKATKRSKLMPLLNEKIFKESNIVLVDESQFFDDIVDFVKEAEKLSKRFYFAGLKGDSNRKPFENISNLIPLMDYVKDISAIDFTTTEMKKAPFTRKKNSKNGNKIDIGGADKYESVSRNTYLSDK